MAGSLQPPLFRDRQEAGRQLASLLEGERGPDTVVVGLARGGVVVAAEVASRLEAPLDALAVRKVGHPWQPEYALGAVAPGGGVYVRAHDGLSDEELQRVVDAARVKAEELDRVLHAEHAAADVQGRTAVLVDDGLATGATMVAAVRWARGRHASRVVVAVPVAAVQSVEPLRAEADDVVVVHAVAGLGAIGFWYARFDQVETGTVLDLLAASRA